MGYNECVICGDMLEVGVGSECENCGIGQDGSGMCDNCVTAGCCDRCTDTMCSSCGKEKFPCCGQVLCGVGVGIGLEDTYCASKHIEKTLKCGHKGCNFQKEDDGCRTCNITEDIITIKSVMGRIKSKSIKSALESMIKDHEGNKRKRLDEKEDLKPPPPKNALTTYRVKPRMDII